MTKPTDTADTKSGYEIFGRVIIWAVIVPLLVGNMFELGRALMRWFLV